LLFSATAAADSTAWSSCSASGLAFPDQAAPALQHRDAQMHSWQTAAWRAKASTETAGPLVRGAGHPSA